MFFVIYDSGYKVAALAMLLKITYQIKNKTKLQYTKPFKAWIHQTLQSMDTAELLVSLGSEAIIDLHIRTT